MSEPKGVIDPRSTLEIRHLAMQMAIDARMPNENLIEVAIEIEGFLLGDNSRIVQAETPEPPQSTQSPQEVPDKVSRDDVVDAHLAAFDSMNEYLANPNGSTDQPE